MRTYFRLKNQFNGKLPPEFRDEELRYPEALPAVFIERNTRPGDVVLDPFAGYGTTLLAAQHMGRVAFGVEADERRATFIRTRVAHPERVVHGDARNLAEYGFPLAALIVTSPPYMAFHERENVLRGTQSAQAYNEYLADMALIFQAAKQQLQPNGLVVIEVSNLKDEIGITTLAWDVARSVSQVLRFEGEIVVTWDHYNYGYDHSYCLLFR